VLGQVSSGKVRLGQLKTAYDGLVQVMSGYFRMSGCQVSSCYFRLDQFSSGYFTLGQVRPRYVRLDQMKSG
jgi:hypothetical protein